MPELVDEKRSVQVDLGADPRPAIARELVIVQEPSLIAEPSILGSSRQAMGPVSGPACVRALFDLPDLMIVKQAFV